LGNLAISKKPVATKGIGLSFHFGRFSANCFGCYKKIEEV